MTDTRTAKRALNLVKRFARRILPIVRLERSADLLF
jgi:hypothetical protein